MPKHPEIIVEMRDGNAYAILAAIRKAMRRAGIPDAEIEAFVTEAKSGDYDHLIQTCMEEVTVY